MTEQTKFGITRRTLAKGAAWSVPAVAVAAAAPAYALSGAKPTITYDGGCKLPGNSCQIPGVKQGYKFSFTIKNNDPVNDIHICDLTFSETGTKVDPLTWVPQDASGCIKVLAGSSVQVPIFAKSSNSANLTFTTTMTAYWAHACPCSDDTVGQHPPIPTTIYVPETRPDCTSCDKYETTSQTGRASIDADTSPEADIEAEAPAVRQAEAPAETTTQARATEQPKAAEKPKAEAPKAEEPAPAPEPKAEEPEPSEPADEA